MFHFCQTTIESCILKYIFFIPKLLSSVEGNFQNQTLFFTFHWTHSSGLELKGRTSPLKYLTQPISNLFQGYHRQNTADFYDEQINSNLATLENHFTQSVCDLCLRVKRIQLWYETAEYNPTAKAKAKAAGRDQQGKIEQVIIQVRTTLSKISDIDKNHMKLNTTALEKLTELKTDIQNLTKQSLERDTCSCKDYLNVEKKKKQIYCWSPQWSQRYSSTLVNSYLCDDVSPRLGGWRLHSFLQRIGI